MKKYENFLNREACLAKLSSQDLFQGTIHVNPKRKKVAYVTCNEIGDVDILIDDEKFRNRAIHDDLVAVELFPMCEWSPVSDISVNIHDSYSLSNVEEEESAYFEVNESLWLPNKTLISQFKRVDRFANTNECAGGSSSNIHDDEYDDISTNYSRTKGAAILHSAKSKGLQPRGKVVFILERRHQVTQIGTISVPGDVKAGVKLPDSQRYAFFTPSDPRYPNLVLSCKLLPISFLEDPFEGMKQVYAVDINSQSWTCESKLAPGMNVRALGEIGTIEAETNGLLLQNGISDAPFTSEELESLRCTLGDIDLSFTSDGELNSWQIPQEEIEKRRDLRSLRIFTIDPPTAKDLDDALHILPLDDNTFEIGVHIADVSYFLREGTALDSEAQRRATSTYLVQRVIPMLPSILCEELCSLNPNVDRLAFSCIWKMKIDGSLCNEPAWFGRTIIRSCAKLDYPTAQRMIDGLIPSFIGEEPEAQFLSKLSEELWESNRRPVGQSAAKCVQDVRLMHSIAIERRRKRFESGALTLNKSSLTFKIDLGGIPSYVSPYIICESNHLVEEYMLLANYLVAQELALKCGGAAFLRNHPTPDPYDIERVKEFCDTIGLNIDTSSARSLQESLRKIRENSADPMIFDAITFRLMHSMDAATYIIAEDYPSDEWKHYALSIPYYTHYSSPIRRYADVTVHRLLDLCLRDPSNAEAKVTDKAQMRKLKEIALNCNEMKGKSRFAQDRSIRVYLAVFLMDNPVEATAIVVGVGNKSFSVLVPQYDISTRIFVDDMLPDVESSFDTATNTITLHKIQNEAPSMRSAGNSRSLKPSSLSITYFTRLRVSLSATFNTLIDVRIDVIDTL